MLEKNTHETAAIIFKISDIFLKFILRLLECRTKRLFVKKYHTYKAQKHRAVISYFRQCADKSATHTSAPLRELSTAVLSVIMKSSNHMRYPNELLCLCFTMWQYSQYLSLFANKPRSVHHRLYERNIGLEHLHEQIFYHNRNTLRAIFHKVLVCVIWQDINFQQIHDMRANGRHTNINIAWNLRRMYSFSIK